MANVENKTEGVPPIETQQAPAKTDAVAITQSQAQAATGPAEVSVAEKKAAVPAGVTDRGLGRTLAPWAEKIKEWWGKRSSFEKEVISFVVVPTIAVCGYVSLWSSPMYISETQFAVRSGTEQPMALDLTSQIFRTNTQSVQDAQVVEAYIRSPDAFAAVDDKLKIIDYYTSRKWDIISRLTSDPTLFDKQVFWNRVSNPVVNPDNGIVTYQIKAYDPKMAQAIGAEVLRQSEGLINEMNERARKDTMELAQKEVDLARDRVAKSQKALEAFRDAHKELDPQATATGLQTLVMQLEGERAKVKAEIADAKNYMQESAPAMVSMKSKLAGIEQQLDKEKARLVGTREGLAINAWVSEYETLMIENEFAKKQLTTAMTALETARASLLAKARYIVPIEKPTLPDESRYPLAWVFTLVTFLGLFLLYGLIRLIIASIREHAGF